MRKIIVKFLGSLKYLAFFFSFFAYQVNFSWNKILCQNMAINKTASVLFRISGKEHFWENSH